MNRNYTPTSAALRSIFAAGAVVAAVAIFSAIGALAGHFEAEAQLAQTQTVMVAQR